METYKQKVKNCPRAKCQTAKKTVCRRGGGPLRGQFTFNRLCDIGSKNRTKKVVTAKNFERQTIPVKFIKQNEVTIKNINALVLGPIAIVKISEGYDKFYSVSHVQTGLRIIKLYTLNDAKKVAIKLYKKYGDNLYGTESKVSRLPGLINDVMALQRDINTEIG